MMNKINQEIFDQTFTKFENILPQFEHLNAKETSAFEFFHHLEKKQDRIKNINI